MTIRLLGHDINIKRLKKIVIDNPEKSDDEFEFNYMGLADLEKGEIQLLKGRSKSLEQETMLHEVIHLISFMTESELTEQQVTTLSTCLYSFIQDNKDLIKEML